MTTHLLSSSGIKLLQVLSFPSYCLCFLLFLSVYYNYSAAAQTKDWDRSLGGSSDDYLPYLRQTTDGGYILGGWSSSNRSGDKSEDNQGPLYLNDYWVVKLKADGTKEWDKTFGGAGEDLLTSLQQTSDGGYILGGFSDSNRSSTKSQESKGASDYWVVKLNADGSKAWDKTLGGFYQDYGQYILQTTDGGYLAGGYSNSETQADKSADSKGAFDFWIVKLNASGTPVWDQTFGGPSNDKLTIVQQTAEGGYILGGYSSSSLGGDKSEESRGSDDYWVVKISAQGHKQWDKTLGGYSFENLQFIYQATDASFMIGGYSESGRGGDRTQESKGGSDYWVVKLANNGDKIWDKAFGTPGDDFLSALQQTSDGNFILGGSASYGTSTDKSEAGVGDLDYWILKIKPDGTKVWDKTIGGKGYELLNSIMQTKDGGYIMGGWSESGFGGDKTEDSKGGFDYWVVKIQDVDTNNTSTVAWNYRYGGTGDEGLLTVIKTSDGGYLTGGYSPSGVSGDKSQPGRGQNDYWIVKTDQAGNKQWDKTFGGVGNDYLNRVVQTLDGGYLLAGSSFSGAGGDKTQSSRGDRDYWIVKIDAWGKQQWNKTFGGSGADELKKVLLLPTGDYLLAGYSNSPADGEKSQKSRGGTDYWLVKITATGKKIWDKRYGGNLNESLTGIVNAANGGFLLGGSSASGKNGDKSQVSQGGSDYWVVRLDKNGNQLWDKSFGGNGQDEAYSLGNSDQDFFIAGQSDSGVSGDKTQPSRGGTDYWLVKLSSAGEKIWDKTFGGNQNDELRASIPTQDGGYLLAGRSFSGSSGTKTQTSRGKSDYWLVQVNNAGALQWDGRYGGTGTEELRAVTQATDGGLILAGRSYSPVSGDKTQFSQGGSDFWLVKVLAPSSVSGLKNNQAERISESPATITNSFTAYPNPARDQVTVSFTLPQTQTATLKIYDSQGREISTLFQGEVKAKQITQVEWQAGNKLAGLYFLQLQTPTQKQQQKLLLTK